LREALWGATPPLALTVIVPNFVPLPGIKQSVSVSFAPNPKTTKWPLFSALIAMA